MTNHAPLGPNGWKSRFLWPFIGWALFVSPLLMVLAGYFIPNMLRGLVLLRTENSASEYLWDCGCLTAIGMFVSALGAAIIRMFDLYAMLQFGYQTDANSIHSPVDQRTVDYWWWHSHSTAWPLSIVLFWVTVSIGYPLYCCWEMRSDIGDIREIDPSHEVPGVYWAGAMLGVLGGTVVASLFLLLVSVAHLILTRKSRSACGLLPYEDQAAWLLDLWLGPVTNEQTQSENDTVNTCGHWLRWFVGPGFFKPSTLQLLPGHLQLFVFMSFAAFGYYLLFDSSYRKTGWASSTFPVGVYALLLLLLIGGFAALVSFILGRLRFHIASISMALFSGILFVLLFVRFGGFVGLDTNRYFAIVEPKDKSNVEVKRTEFAEITDEDGSFVRIAKSKLERASNDPSKADEVERKSLKDVYNNWHFPRGPDGRRTMVVVTASGGGIQASAWTAKVLANMDEECSGFSESIGLVSGVSGGSVGSMYYLGKRGFRKNAKSEVDTPQLCMSISPTTRKAIQKAASHSSLEAIGWGLAFPDFARTVPGLNFKVGKEDDRGLALESQWWTRMGAQSLTAGGGASNTAKTDEETSMMRDLRMRDLVSATNKGLVPPVIFNSTTVETGQRTMIASFATNLDATSSNASTEIVEYERISRPIDFFGFYEPLFHNPRDVNPRVSTAVRLSSSFAYVTPVARPVLPTDRLASNLTPLLKRRANYHLCDGGYSENTGLVGTVRVITDLINQHIKEGTAPPFDRILFLSIESFPDNLVETEDDVTGLSSGCIGPLSAIFASRVASQAERAELELELLIRSEDQSFARKSDGEIMAVFDIDSYENYRSNAEQLVSRIESSNLADDEKEELAGFLTPISKTKLRPDDRESMTTKIPLRQANAIKAKADKFIQREGMFRESFSKAFSDDDQSLVNTFVVQSRAMAQLDVPSDDHKVASANSVFNLSIACIQFRFDPRSGAVMRSGEEGIKKDLKDTKVPNPPLSWMLSPYDKYRIDLAWENQLQRLKGNVATAAPSQEENDERLMPPEMLQRILKFDKEVK